MSGPPFSSLDFRVLSLYMQTQKCIIGCLLGFIRIWAGSVSQGSRRKFGEKGKGGR